MKKTATVVLSLVTVAVGVWVLSGTQTLNSACTLRGQPVGVGACDYRLPFYLLGAALMALGAVTLMVTIVTQLRTARRKSIRRAGSTISTLHSHDVDPLRDVA